MPKITITKTTTEVAEVSVVVYEKYSRLQFIAAHVGVYLRPTQLTGDGETMGLLCEITNKNGAPSWWLRDFIAQNAPAGSMVFIDENKKPMVGLGP